ncbi:MAG: hypothetical protein HYT39_02745 [Candidatus Sungbacteria bacterium]|nr:hypothetical protein [Candidatus Sungbacteria bacterium]
MKKLFLFTLFLLLVASTVYAASSAFYFVSAKENVAVIFFSYDQWNLVPFTSTAWSKIITKDSLSAELKERFNAAEVDIKESDITAAFVFDSKDRKYVQVAGRGTDQSKLQTIDYDDVSRYPAVWIYVKAGSDKQYAKNMWLKINPERMPKITDFTMKRGWNFVWLTPDITMISMASLNEYKGTCSIDKVAIWEGKWNVHNYTAEVAQDLKNGTPGPIFLLKVMSDCQLRYEPVVPQAPSLPE